MYEFRIIEMEDGNQVIDRNLKTPYSSLTPLQMVEYAEIDVQLAIVDKMKRRKQKETERQQELFFVKHFSLKKAFKFPFFIQGNSLLSAGTDYASWRIRACSIR